MTRITALLSLGLMMLLALSGCARGPQEGKQSKAASETKVVWIAKDGYVSRSYEVRNGTDDQTGTRLPEPGDVILFRTTEEDILGTTGKAGEAFKVDEAKKLRKIGEFVLTRTDEELVKEYQNR